jgi:type III pantothenate kinase
VPELTRIWHHLCQKYFSAQVFTINGYTPLGLSYDVADPGFIGADLIVNAFAAWQKYQSACIIIDLGTATTIQLITSTGRFLGTIIAPGIRTAATQLFEKAALLSEIELTPPPRLLGTNTSDAMLSGIVTGHAMMIEGFISKLNSAYPEHHPLKVIATGGIADLITPMVDSIDVMDKALTLNGLNLAANLLAIDSGCCHTSMNQLALSKDN